MFQNIMNHFETGDSKVGQRTKFCVTESCFRYAKKYPSNTAFIVDDQHVSWCQLADKIKHYTREVEILSPSRPILLFSNSINNIALLFALNQLNVETILVSSYYCSDKAKGFMDEFDADYLITADNATITILCHRNTQKKNWPENKSPYICLLTAGTTGLLKCVKHSWSALSHDIEVHDRFLGKRWFLGYPITHFGGMKLFMRCFLNGGILVIPKDFKAQHGVEALMEHRVNYLSCTPTYMRQLLMLTKFDWIKPALRHVSLGGEIADQQILDFIKQRIPHVKVTHIYGSTELGTSIEVTDGKEGFDVSFLDGKKLRIIKGELFVRTSSGSMVGYLKSVPLRDEWVGTRDLVKIEGDRVKFLGRKDDVINVGGYKVNPPIVERVIRKLPGIAEVSIVPARNPIAGNLVKAVVSLKSCQDESAVRAEIVQICKKNLPYYMVPRLFEFVETVAVTESQKLMRRNS